MNPEPVMVSTKYIEFAHGPAAEDGNWAAMCLIDLAHCEVKRCVDVRSPELIVELRSVAQLWAPGGDAAPWIVGIARKLLCDIEGPP